ncbi:ribosome maturation factor RimM [soil metagenome]
MSDAPRLLLAGKVGKPHGLAGELFVAPISDDPKRFDPGSVLAHESGRELVVETSRRHRNRLLVKFHGVGDRDDAEALRGALYVTPERLRALEADEYWEHEIVGCNVATAEGRHVGIVARVVPGAAQDLLVVDTSRGERLVPIVKDIVVEIDVQDRRVRIEPPQGLLD